MDSQPLPIPISDIRAPIWPRRVTKACASCRHDKTRCDGARPCSSCVKKGYTADRCIDGCEPCRRARVRCEAGTPCIRCREMQLECIDESGTTPRQWQESSVSRTVRSNGVERAKLACQNCRRDNKKCDDQRPCSRCVARSEECIHVGRGPKLVKLRCEGCRQENKKCEDARPCKHCVESAKDCVNLSRRGGGHGTRVKAACVNCRRDKVRCDGARPCSTCVRKHYDCFDRACKSCLQKEVECTHRGQDPEQRDDSFMTINDNASSSNTLLDQKYLAQAVAPYPPMYGPLGPVVYYYPLPQPPGPPQTTADLHGPPSMMQMYSPDRSGYFPVIDPHIDDPPIL